MRILLVGAFGYLGTNLAKYLLKAGNEVVLSSRAQRVLSIKEDGSSFSMIDFSNKKNLSSITKEVNLIIYAGGMNAGNYVEQRHELIQTRIEEVKALADAAVKNMVNQIIYISTIHVYSSPLYGSISETSPLKNMHPYALAHRGSEDALFRMTEGGNTRAIVLRLSNVFGGEIPNDKNIWDLVAHDLCRSAFSSGQIRINPSAQAEQRDFLSVNELCRLFGYLLENTTRFNHEIYNIASGKSIKILELAKLVQKISNKNFNLNASINPSLRNFPIGKSKLIIDTSRLYSAGFKINDNLEAEINNVLKQCNERF